MKTLDFSECYAYLIVLTHDVALKLKRAVRSSLTTHFTVLSDGCYCFAAYFDKDRVFRVERVRDIHLHAYFDKKMHLRISFTLVNGCRVFTDICDGFHTFKSDLAKLDYIIPCLTQAHQVYEPTAKAYLNLFWGLRPNLSTFDDFLVTCKQPVSSDSCNLNFLPDFVLNPCYSYRDCLRKIFENYPALSNIWGSVLSDVITPAFSGDSILVEYVLNPDSCIFSNTVHISRVQVSALAELTFVFLQLFCSKDLYNSTNTFVDKVVCKSNSLVILLKKQGV